MCLVLRRAEGGLAGGQTSLGRGWDQSRRLMPLAGSYLPGLLRFVSAILLVQIRVALLARLLHDMEKGP